MEHISTQSTRLAWVDQLRGILFLMVILCHLRCPEEMRYVTDPVFLAGFFVLSGWLYKRKDFLTHLKGIFNTLLVPYFLYSIIISVWGCDKSINGFFDILLINFIGGGDSLWFIPCLILVQLMFSIYCTLDKTDKYLWLLLLLCTIAFFVVSFINGSTHLSWNADTALYCTGYFGLGYLIRMWNVTTNRNRAYGLIAAYIVLCIIAGVMGIGGGDVDLHNNRFPSSVTFLILSLLGSFAFLDCAPYVRTTAYFNQLGKYTLFAFPFHSYVFRAILKVLDKVELMNFYQDYFSICVIVVGLATGLVLIAIGGFLTKYCPLLMGKYKVIK